MAQSASIPSLIDKLEEVVFIYTRLVKQLQKEIDLPASFIPIIEIIQDDKLTLKEITEYAMLDKSTISRQVNQMVKKGLVTRESGEDRRFVYFSLSDDAKEAYRSYQFELNKRMTAAFAPWPEDEKQLLYVLMGRLGRSMLKQM
ncbi:MarR family winged helix-turn-helix transcriptional regulator [Atopococcus tabaci]|uniref:MarR family winged helix-turn-helix transcriptional regulator n=1 Tax=Atopococcus tabaci TaxID=269774 RepID=UPI0004047DDD|nr:MarR family transcriptional regulator [Atopococcus tabaci]